jgi:hypothetical protein
VHNTYNNYNIGIDEARAREIFREMFSISIREYTDEAHAYADQRMERLEDALLQRLLKCAENERENNLRAFADPSFQVTLTQAQKAAISTERDADYDLLAELLVCRITKGQQRKNRAGIRQAIKIVDQIDDDALCALTVCHSVNLIPLAGSGKEGLSVLDNIFEKLMYMDLPSGTAWIDHLDILKAVRFNQVETFRKLGDIYLDNFTGYAAVGIPVDSDAYKRAMDLLSEVNIDPSILIPNEWVDGYVKLPVVNKESIKNLTIKRNITVDGVRTAQEDQVNESDIPVLGAVWDLYSTDEALKDAVASAFQNDLDCYPSLKRLRTWWDALPVAFDITHVGTVLAHTNARRCDESLPELPLIQ